MKTFPYKATVILALALLAASCGSTSAGGAARTDTRVALGPYVASVSPHGFRIAWETEDPVPTRLYWGTDASTPSLVGNAEPSTRHEALVAGLEPGTTYWYRLGQNADPRGAIPVSTRPDPVRSLRVAVVSDTHSTGGVHSRIVREIVAEKPDLLLHLGDLSLRRGKKEGGDEVDFFRVEGPLLRSLLIVPVLGNHDGGGPRFIDLFVRPRGAGEEAYSLFVEGPLALVTLDTNESLGASSVQWHWLEETLRSLQRDSGILFRVVAMHWGPYSSGSGHGSNIEARYSLVPLFERYGVDVVFSGHDHVYERSTVNGIRYVVTGGGGGGGRKPHDVLGDPLTQVSASTPHHGLLTIDGRTLSFTAKEASSGRLLDSVRIEKPAP